MEGGEVALLAGCDDFFDAVVARNKDGIGPLHAGEVDDSGGSPMGEPGFDGGEVFELGEEVFFTPAEVAEDEGEVGVLFGHEVEKGLNEGRVAFSGEAQLGRELFVIGHFVEFGEF